MGKMEKIALEKGATVRWVTKRVEGGFGFDAYWAKMKNRGGGAKMGYTTQSRLYERCSLSR